MVQWGSNTAKQMAQLGIGTTSQRSEPMEQKVSSVLDRRRWDLEVVVVRRAINLGTGNLEWGVNGEGLRKGRSVYEQPETKVDGILSQQGGFPSK